MNPQFKLVAIKRPWVPHWLFVVQSWLFNSSMKLTGERDTAFTNLLKWVFTTPVDDE